MVRRAVRAASVLFLVAGLLGLALVPTLLAPTSPPVRTARIVTDTGGVDFLNVSVADTLVFTTSINEVQPGDLVHVVVTNIGTITHTFTLSPTAGFTFPTTDSSSDLLSYFDSHAPIINIQVGAVTGGKYFGNFTAPPVGVYEYVCEEPGHFPSMSGLLGSGETPGSLTTTSGPGAPVFIISGTIVGLVILALVLGFVVGKRRGSEDEVPPERLGYPEPHEPAPQPPVAP
jgi:plastocyanin